MSDSPHALAAHLRAILPPAWRVQDYARGLAAARLPGRTLDRRLPATCELTLWVRVLYHPLQWWRSLNVELFYTPLGPQRAKAGVWQGLYCGHAQLTEQVPDPTQSDVGELLSALFVTVRASVAAGYHVNWPAKDRIDEAKLRPIDRAALLLCADHLAVPLAPYTTPFEYGDIYR
jgi:hypothetical protein